MRSKQRYRKGKFMVAGVIAMTLLFSGMTYSTEVHAAELQKAALANTGGGQAEINKAKTVWYYKIVDGNKYMRLFDCSNGKWLTPWLLCP